MAAKEIFVSEEKKHGELFVLAVEDKQFFINEADAIGIIQSLSSQLLMVKCQT